jgi:hypothetical protein
VRIVVSAKPSLLVVAVKWIKMSRKMKEGYPLMRLFNG